jgi:hypothetical protein
MASACLALEKRAGDGTRENTRSDGRPRGENECERVWVREENISCRLAQPSAARNSEW